MPLPIFRVGISNCHQWVILIVVEHFCYSRPVDWHFPTFQGPETLQAMGVTPEMGVLQKWDITIFG